MKRVTTMFLVGTVALMFFAAPGSAQMGTSPYGVTASVELTVDPAFTYDGAKHVANGIALRNEARGTISLRGVPLASSVVQAYLYWNFSDGKAVGNNTDVVYFNGNRVAGAKRADSGDPCWGMAGNHTYRAVVTAFIPSSRPNGDYEVFLDNAVSTSGQNPWAPGEAQTIRLEGATLIVVYKNANTVNNSVFIYDALNGSTFSGGTGTFVLNHRALSGLGLYTMCGADGQRGVGNAYTNAASNETGTFNAVQFSGPPVAASDWDGSAGWPLAQLWDVHTHEVTLSGTTSTVKYTAGVDCLTPVFFVIQLGP